MDKVCVDCKCNPIWRIKKHMSISKYKVTFTDSDFATTDKR